MQSFLHTCTSCFSWKKANFLKVFKGKYSPCQLLKFKTVAKSLMKWVWISVNSSWIGLVGQRREKLVGHSKLFPYVCFQKQKIIINCCAIPNSDILFSMMVTLRKKTSWAGSESLCGDEAWNATACSFVMLQFLILILIVTGPNLWFRSPEVGGLSPGHHWGGSSRWQCRGKSRLYFHKTDLGDSLGLHRFDLWG